jgi:hypothetical protein
MDTKPPKTPKPYKITEYNGQPVREYESGALLALNGRIVKGPASAVISTSERAHELVAARQQHKRAAVAAGAAKAVSDSVAGSISLPNDMQVVEAIAEMVTQKALDPTSAKQVDAARFIYQEMGVAEAALSQQPPVADDTRTLIHELATIARAALRENGLT